MHGPLSATVEAKSTSSDVRCSRAGIRRLFLPSLSDVLFLVLISILFLSGAGWSGLLADGDTGWHIRTGQHILETHAVPVWDLFSYAAPGTHWYAWEWLADLVFAMCHQMAGLKGVVLFSGTVICLTMMVLFRYLIWRGASVHIAVFLTLFVADTLRFHYLARPHIFTTLFAVTTLWMLDSDWSRSTRAIWLLVPMATLWANIHGGFLVLLLALGSWAVSAIVRRDSIRFARYAALGIACAAATLVNPYGWQLHRHIWEYLRSDWLMRIIDEFQSPLARGGSFLQFEVLLFLGLICTFELLRSRRYHEAILVLFWAHAALTSARHITIYAVVAAPPIADQLTRVWAHWTNASARGSVMGTLRGLSDDMRSAARWTSVWVPVFLLLLACGALGVRFPVEFPPKFPTRLVARNIGLLDGGGRENARILSLDSWGGYLDYKLYPKKSVFIDGRSDYYGSAILKDYISTRSASDNWQTLAAHYRWQFALIPPDWPLAGILSRNPGWILRDKDGVALLFERVAP